jgi:UDP-N-acetylglucosamine:LPS N-acetylglucosamine transferase
MARGLRDEIVARHPGAEVTITDGLGLRSDRLANGARDLYKNAVNKVPGGYGGFYDASRGALGLSLLNGASKAVLARPIEKEVLRQNPDVIVSTFPAVTAALGKLRNDKRIEQPVLATLIDPDPHKMWFSDGVDSHLMIVPGDESRVAMNPPLKNAEAPLTHVQPPIDSRVGGTFDGAATRAEFGLPAEGPVVLVSGGSLGLQMDEKFVAKLLKTHPDAHFALLTGKDTALADRIGSIAPDRVTAIPFTKKMPELMDASDAVITNSGGMTTLESFGSDTPVILHNVVPGHGVDGAQALEDDGLAEFARNTDELRAALAHLGKADGKLKQNAARARELYDVNIPHMADVVIATGRTARRERAAG